MTCLSVFSTCLLPHCLCRLQGRVKEQQRVGPEPFSIEVQESVCLVLLVNKHAFCEPPTATRFRINRTLQEWNAVSSVIKLNHPFYFPSGFWRVESQYPLILMLQPCRIDFSSLPALLRFWTTVLALLTGLAATAAPAAAPVPIADPVGALVLKLRQRNLPDTARLNALRDLSRLLQDAHNRQALKYAEMVVQQAMSMQQWEIAFQWHFNLMVYAQQYEDWEAAMSYAQSGLTFAQQRYPAGAWEFYQGLAIIASETKDPAAGLRYMKQAYRMQRQAPANKVRPRQRAGMLVNLANTFLAVQQYDSVLFYAGRALPYFKQTGDPRGMAYLYEFRGQVYQMIKPQTAAYLDSSARNSSRALQLVLANGLRREATAPALALADARRLQNQPAESVKAAELALQLGQELKMPTVRADALAALAWAYADLGNVHRSHEYEGRARSLRDSLFNDTKANALAQLQGTYAVKQQEQRLVLLAERNRVAEAIAQAQASRAEVLLQQGKVSEARVQIQQASLKMLRQQNLVSQSQALAVRSHLEVLTQENLAEKEHERTQEIRLLLLAVILVVAGMALIAVSRLYLRLQQKSALLEVANREKQQSVEEKEVLVQEIQHRVKNNLQIMSSLLGWQRETMPDPQLAEVLAGNQARIQSMALVHEYLYHAENLAQVRLDIYLTELLNSLHRSLASPQKDITLSTDLEPVLMDAKEAAYFGLLVNELVTNAYKHAFVGRTSGTLHIGLVRKDSGFQLSVSDNGQGLPETGFTSKSTSIGIQLVKTLTKQLKATIAVLPQPVGTRLHVTRT